MENQTIKQVASAFPESKIVSRGNEIRIQGAAPEILRINDLVNSLLNHYHRYGKVTPDNVAQLLHEGEQATTKANSLDEVLIYGTRGTVIKPKTPNQKDLIAAAAKNDLVFALGPAGTGKTYISVAMAVRALKNKEVKKIIITRPAVEAGENLGFLPGDLKEKIDPYLRPIYDALHDMVPAEKLRYYMEENIVEIAPLAYMRGRTLNNAFILLDEAQNTTISQMKMLLTRTGFGSKVVLTGDLSQVDLPKGTYSGLKHALTVLRDVKGVFVNKFTGKDIVRHPLVQRIVDAYEKHERND